MPNPRRRPRPVKAVRLEDTLTERQWALSVEGLLDFYGWRWHHSPDNRPTQAGGGRHGRQRVGDRGFPDYIAARHLEGAEPELAFLELKRQGGRLGPGQPEWLVALNALAVAVEALGDIAAAGAGAGELVEPPPRIIVGVYRPSQRRELEDELAGPGGRNAYIGRDDR